MKDGVPSVQVGVGVWPDEMTLPAILTISALPSDEALLFDRISNCTSDILPIQKGIIIKQTTQTNRKTRPVRCLVKPQLIRLIVNTLFELSRPFRSNGLEIG